MLFARRLVVATAPLKVLGALCLLAGTPQILAADEDLRASLEDATVRFSLPEQIAVGSEAWVKVDVTPRRQDVTPVRVRVRLGMPDHGHWVNEESSQPFRAQTMAYTGTFPMQGRYRLRVWLEFADGRESRTGLDFTVAPEQPLAPAVVN